MDLPITIVPPCTWSLSDVISISAFKYYIVRWCNYNCYCLFQLLFGGVRCSNAKYQYVSMTTYSPTIDVSVRGWVSFEKTGLRASPWASSLTGVPSHLWFVTGCPCVWCRGLASCLWMLVHWFGTLSIIDILYIGNLLVLKYIIYYLRIYY